MQEFQRLKAKLLPALKAERKQLQERLSLVESQMVAIDAESTKDESMPFRLDYSYHRLLKGAETGLTIEELLQALANHRSLVSLKPDKARAKLEKSLKEDKKVEAQGSRWCLAE